MTISVYCRCPGRLVAVLVIVAAVAAVGDAANITLKIGCAATITGAYSQYWPHINNSWTLWQHLVKQSGGIKVGNDRMFFDFVIQDGQSNAATSVAISKALMSQVDIMFTPYSSGLTLAVANVTANTMLTIAGHGSAQTIYETSNGRRRFQYLTGLAPPSGAWYESFIEAMALKGAKTIFIIQENGEFPRAATAGAILSAENNRMTVVGNFTVPLVSVMTPAIKAQLQQALLQAMRLNPELLLSSVYLASCQVLIELAKEMNYYPKAWFFTLCPGLPELVQAVGNDVGYIYGSGIWDKELKGRDFTETQSSTVHWFIKDQAHPQESPMQMYNAVKAWGGIEPSYQIADSMAMCYALQTALMNAGKFDLKAVQFALERMWESSFYGRLALNHAGQDDLRPMVLYQFQPVGNSFALKILSPLSAAQADAIYPAPTWQERVYAPSFFGTWNEIVVFSLACLGIFVCVVLSAIFVTFRKTRVVRASSHLFCQLMLFGGILMYLALISSPRDNTKWSCAAFPWLVGVGMVLFVGSLLVKNYRIWRLFTNKTMRRFTITNQQLLVMVGSLLAVMLVLVGIWIGLAPPNPVMVVPDVYRPALNFNKCAPYGGSADFFAFIVIGYCAILFIAGTIFAVLARNAPVEFNEAKYISAAMYQATFSAMLLGVLYFSPVGQADEFHTLWYSLRAAGALMLVTATLWLVFFPKIMQLYSELTVGPAADVNNPLGLHRAAARGASSSSTTANDGRPEPGIALQAARGRSRGAGNRRTQETQELVTDSGADSPTPTQV